MLENEGVQAGSPPSNDLGAGGPSPAAAPPSSAPAGAQSGVPGGPPPEQTVPYSRFHEVVSDRQTLNEKVRDLTAQLEERQRRIQALAGVEPSATADPQLAAIDETLRKMYPWLSKAEALAAKGDLILKLLDRAPSLEANANFQYDTLAARTLDTVYSKVGSAYGGTLNDKQKGIVFAAFTSFLDADISRQVRYTRADPSVVEDFWSYFSTELLDPVRRNAAVTTTERGRRIATLPQGGTTGPPPPAGPAAPATGDLDARLDAAWKSLNARGSGG
jgi:hypothetical protein